MNPQENQDWDSRLQELETRIHQPSSQSSLRDWLDRLPYPGKVALGVVSAIVIFSLLKTFLQMVSALLSIAILGVVLYLLYKFLLAPQK